MFNSSIIEIPLAPQALLDALAQQPSHHAPRPQGRAPGPDAQSNPEFEQLLAEVGDAGQGQRNDTFNRAAFRAAQLAGAGKLDRDEAEAALTAAALDCGLRGDEITRTLESAFEAGMAQPRERDLRAERPQFDLESGNIAGNVEGLEALLNEQGAEVYERGTALARVVVDNPPRARGGVSTPRIVTIDRPDLAEIITKNVEVRKFDGRSNRFRPCNPPAEELGAMLAGQGRRKFPKLDGVANRPVMARDCSIFCGPGYDPNTRTVVVDPPAMPHIPDRPSKADAEAALLEFHGLLNGFCFVDEPSRSVALSGLLSTVARESMDVVPLHGITAHAPGSGKSYLGALFSALNNGQRPAVIAAGQDQEETDKRIIAAALSGCSLIMLDNVNGPIGGDVICQVVEQSKVAIRRLGSSNQEQLENNFTVIANGNNMRAVGDMVRRTIMCSLDAKVERPELRTFNSNPMATILADRGKFLAAAFTIMRAYIAAGRPGRLPPLASFEAWSDNPRSALVWLGCADPLDTMETARGEDPVTTSLRMLLAAWHEAMGDTPKTTGEIKEAAESIFGSGKSDLEQALIEVAEGRMGEINSKKLGWFLLRHNGRIVDGLRLQSHDSHAKQKKWSVRHV